MMELHKATAGDGLMLVFSRAPRNYLVTVGAALFIGVIAYVAFARIFPKQDILVALGVAVATLGAIGITFLPYVTRVVADFDKDAETIRVTTTRSDGTEESERVGFKEVRTLQLFQTRAKGTQTQTLTLITRDGRKLFLGEERQHSGWLSPPFSEGIAGMVERIRKETGVGGKEELPMGMQAAGI